MLFDNKIKDKKFQKLYEIKKYWTMVASNLFEIKNNLIGVCWKYDDDEESDNSFESEQTYNINHLNDGITIYSIENNQIKEKKILKQKIFK